MAKEKKNGRIKKIFSRKTRVGKAPPLSHTKGYYRFAKDFPSATDSGGYRDNSVISDSPSKKAALRRRLALLFTVVFIIAFVCTALSLSLSRLPAAADEATTDAPNVSVSPLSGMKAVYLTGETLSYSSVDALAANLRTWGVNTVVIEFKDPLGNIYFRPSASVSAEALYRASEGAGEMVKNLQSAGFSVYAMISCFADDIYARSNRDSAAYTLTAPTSGSSEEVRSIWYGATGSHALLSPYSSEVTSYLTSVISDVIAMGTDGIILSGLTTVAPDSSVEVSYPGQGEDDPSPNEEIAAFAADISSLSGTPVGVIIDESSAVAAVNNNTPHPLFNCGSDYIIPQITLSLDSPVTLSGTVYDSPTASPYEFTSQLIKGISALAAGDESGAILPLISAWDGSSRQLTALGAEGLSSYILYSSTMEYSRENFELG